MTRSSLHLLALLGLAVAAGPTTAEASSSDDYLTLTGLVNPNVIFLLDLSSSMDAPCSEATDSDTAADGDWANPCLQDAINAISQVMLHYDWVNYAVVGTAEDPADSSFFPIAPLGSSQTEVAAALASVTTWSGVPTRNLAEALADIGQSYLSNTDPDNQRDDDGDGLTGDWLEGPISYACQETHIIVLTNERPASDGDGPSAYASTITSDVKCNAAARTYGGSPDRECQYDNFVYSMYNTDYRADLTGDQVATVHTIGLGVEPGSLADDLYASASDNIGGAGIYTSVEGPDEILGAILSAIRDIRSGVFSRSTPVISTDGKYLIYAFHEITGDNPLSEGHVRAYEIEDDPTMPDYGQVQYDGPSEFGGAVWDAGDLLVSRPVTASESNPDDRDGFGKRDIYTFFDEANTLMTSESVADRRQGIDLEFVYAVGGNPAALDLILDTTSTLNPPCADDQSYDLNDDCQVDEDDLQSLVDFARGLPEATYRYFGTERGRWKLGDSPNSVPVVVQKRNNSYTVDPSYRKFLKEMEASDYPDIVLIAANDGMLHAFQLEDDPGTIDTEEGEELWAWIPGYLLYRSHDAEWAGRLIDQMLYGRTFLFDGTPVVEDVWIDKNGDNKKDCSTLGSCEWRRIVVVQQGKGGPTTLALDITDPTAPTFLWEQTDETDYTAMGYTTSRPVIANIYDTEPSDSAKWHDRWVAMWGSGRAVPFSASAKYYESTEANLYMWHTGDDYWGTSLVGYSDHGDNGHPESSLYGSTLDIDSDGEYEYGYISAALAVVDVDSDGDADTVYFPVTAAYNPTDETGSGPGDVKDPGSTWMYKACINTDDPDDLTWIEFFDPLTDAATTVGSRPEVYYAATTAWHQDGALGIYWGTGSPYTRDTTRNGYLFAVKDREPMYCTSDSMEPISACGTDGVYTLDEGEILTGEPIVFAGVIYFSTWVPEEDLCEGGTGRVYALAYDSCAPGMDTDGDGVASDLDDDFVEVDGYPSAVTVTSMGTIMVGTANPTVDGTGDAVTTIEAVTNPFNGTATLAWMEVF